MERGLLKFAVKTTLLEIQVALIDRTSFTVVAML
jgi:hypothetical protein